MRIVSVTTSFPRHEDDHAGRFVFDLHAGLVEEGHDVTTLCPATPGAPARETGAAGEVRRLEYHDQPDLFYGDGLEINVAQVRRPWQKLRGFIHAARTAVRSIASGDDVRLAHWLWPCGRAVAEEGRTVLGVGHGGDLHHLGRPVVGRLLSRGISGSFRGVLCTSEKGADIVRRRLRPEVVSVAPMGVDPQRFRPAVDAPPTGWPEDYVLAVGRLVPIKGFDVLVRAAKGLEMPVVIVGEGPEAQGIQSLAKETGVPVYLPGHLGPDAVACAMRHARILVVPSRSMAGGRVEGFPVVCVEALQTGTGVIASRTGGLPDVLPPDLLFEPDDVSGLRALLRQVRKGRLSAPRVDVPLQRRETARTLLDLLG